MQNQMLMDRQAQEENVMAKVQDNWDKPRHELLERMTEALHDNFRHYTGVYIYLVEGDTLVLANFRGRPTEHTRIPVGEGICGRAVRVRETVTVDDVNSDPEYIACSLDTNSEIVVPILRGAEVFGEIDIDSDVPAAFKPEDRTFLERLAERLQDKF